jgi:benzoyl-CoA reductase/2-hydroxyglutaryl-CoA dehydratase subunit BcrC/BadD/HgdB
MLKTILGMMEQQTAEALKTKRSFRASWYHEWAKLFLKAFEPGNKVVYTSLYAFPMEILAACDVVPFDFEIAGSLISSTPAGVPTMAEAEERGYSRDLCSFHRVGLGAVFKNYFPEPDLLITTSFYCEGKAKANDVLASIAGKESLLLDIPQEVTRETVHYVEGQLRRIAARIAETAGHSFDEDRLKEALRNSNRSRKATLRILDLLKHNPSPWNGTDLIGYSINGHLFDGYPMKEVLDNLIIEELQARIGAGKLRPERHRAYWFAWLPVYQSNLFETLRERQISIAMCETYRMYWDEIDEDRPFEGLALKCLRNPFIGPLSRRFEELDTLKNDYGFDSAVLFATPACRHSKTALRAMSDTLAVHDIPLLVIDMDIADPRAYAPEQIKTRLEAFAEIIDGRR